MKKLSENDHIDFYRHLAFCAVGGFFGCYAVLVHSGVMGNAQTMNLLELVIDLLRWQLPELREQFDMATARAVAAMPVLTEYCLPFVKQGGVFAAMKGPSETAEQAETAAKLLGGEIVGEESYTLPTAGERKLIRIRKTAPTPQKYPRRSDKIKKQPLG